MRLSDVIKQCRSFGVSSIDLHPNGKVAKVVFVHERQAIEKVVSREDELREAQAGRNPRKNAADLALTLMAEKESARDRNAS